MMKKHPLLNIWINGQDWLNTFERLRHFRDLYTIQNNDPNFSGQPNSYKEWVYNSELPQLVQNENYKKQINSVIEELDLKINNLDREKNNVIKSLEENKSKLLEEKILYEKALKVKIKKVAAKTK